MADKKMNDFATASDGAYIYAESSSGEQIKISKADLASVVAELMGNPLRYYPTLPSYDANDFVTNGWWECKDLVSNMPCNWCYLFVYRMSNSKFVVQFAMNNEGGAYFYRKKYAGTWFDWKQISA